MHVSVQLYARDQNIISSMRVQHYTSIIIISMCIQLTLCCLIISFHSNYNRTAKVNRSEELDTYEYLSNNFINTVLQLSESYFNNCSKEKNSFIEQV